MPHEAASAPSIQEMAQRERLVFYTELQNGNPVYIAQTSLFKGISEEINRHLNNIILLALYFDRIVFYADDLLCIPFPTVVKIAHGVITTTLFRSLVDAGVIVFCGRRYRTKAQMIDASLDLASQFRGAHYRIQYDNELDEIMQRAEFFNRSSDDVDVYFPKLFKDTYEDVYPVAENGIEKRLFDITLDTAYNVNYLSLVTYYDKLWFFDKIPRRVLQRYFQTYAFGHHLNSHLEYPNVYTFADARNPLERNYFYKMNHDNKTISNFAVAPEVFQTFLLGFLTPIELEKLLDPDYAAERLKNLRADPSWPAFKEAYGQAIDALSEVHREQFIGLATQAQEAANGGTQKVLRYAGKASPAYWISPDAASQVTNIVPGLNRTLQIARVLGGLDFTVEASISKLGHLSPKLLLTKGRYRPFLRRLKRELSS